MSRAIVAAVLAALAAVAVAAGSAIEALGAHPFWAGSVPLIGLALALPLYAAALRWPLPGLASAVCAVICGALAARFGKAAFAASFAENALAGRAWYLGWIVLCAGAIALTAMVFLRLLRRSAVR